MTNNARLFFVETFWGHGWWMSPEGSAFLSANNLSHDPMPPAFKADLAAVSDSRLFGIVIRSDPWTGMGLIAERRRSDQSDTEAHAFLYPNLGVAMAAHESDDLAHHLFSGYANLILGPL